MQYEIARPGIDKEDGQFEWCPIQDNGLRLNVSMVFDYRQKSNKTYDCNDLIVSLKKKSKIENFTKEEIVYPFDCSQKYGSLLFDLDKVYQKGNCHTFQDLGGGQFSMNIHV